ncbi:D-glycero-alpha-D-manno-heptose-1,7-bisphosphate 7-phosphatase [Paramaledivibacter caminithermalis]|jgi:histidinol-phosphate phosphatase family protein|uniref:D,D-heptose 1,7-bisphosphate phosphatase n=1 Tax=Paramaledivibacter caminithermalis (strain DSM 15212 / CIP 107654 / DViRD3) TaxID=1121301 RepID=A0A1M6Q4W7_PARC5|nr:HAD family hydrolase [Paramaledivibacter caminithermalis]SHK15252.1 D-glycero-D-manno-heptose 1,7-bisphosphate phosphatase [Paramaledivibacter caminithermalis DSM 15212]
MNKAVFLDRDGVINDNYKPVNSPRDLRIYPWSAEAILKLNTAGYYVFVVTNQGGIEMGYFKEKDLEEIHNKLLNEIEKSGASIDEIDFCPHFKTKCECRKPEAGMLKRLAKKYNIDLNSCFMIGDRDIDIEAGIKAGCKTIKIGKPYKKADYIAKNLMEAVKLILK